MIQHGAQRNTPEAVASELRGDEEGISDKWEEWPRLREQRVQRPWDRTTWRSGQGGEASGLKQESIMTSSCLSVIVAKGLSVVGKESPERCAHRVGPKSSDRCPSKRAMKRNRLRRGNTMGRQAETGGRQPQAKEHREPLEAGRGRKHPPWSLCGECCPEDTLLSEFRPLEL